MLGFYYIFLTFVHCKTTEEAERFCMDKKCSAVFGRLFYFGGIIVVILLCALFVCACDMSDVSSLFSPNEDFQVTFVLNNGEDNVVWHTGDEVPSPKKDGYKLVGWCNDVELTGLTYLNFETLNLSTNIVLYAKWQELDDIEGVKFESADVVYDGEPHTIAVENLPDGARVRYSADNTHILAGVYTVDAYITMPDHKDLTLSATLTINKAVVDGLSFDNLEVDWDGSEHSVFVSGDIPEEVKVTYSGNAQSEVGKHEVVAHFSVSDNYEPIADMKANITIKEVYFSIKYLNGDGNTHTIMVAHGQGVNDSDITKVFEKIGYIASWENKSVDSVYENIVVNAVYEPIEYKINLESNGICVKSVAYTIEEEVELEDWKREHYTFGGWYTDIACASARVYNIEKGSVGDKTFYAKWAPIEYTLTYNLNGGLNSPHNVNNGDKYVFTVESDELALENPSKNHYVFEGWYANEDFSGAAWDSVYKGVSGDRTLYAKWSPEKYTIEYKMNGGENSKDNPSEYNYESDEIELMDATREHYEFVGWFNERNEKVERIEKGTCANIVVCAEWKAIEHKIEYVLNGGTHSENPSVYTIESGEIVLKDALKAYYEFGGWYDSENFEGNKITSIRADTAKDVVLYAKFSPIQYKIAYALNGGSCQGNPDFYTVESEITLEPATREYYDFMGWYSGDEKIEKIEIGSHGEINLSAKWKAVEFYIEYVGVEDITGYTTKYTIESDDIILPKQSKDYYTFDGWFANAEFSGSKIEIVRSAYACDFVLYAKFTAIEYQIVYNYDGGESVENPTSYTVESPSFALLPTMKEGYTFDGWYDGDKKVEGIQKGSHGDLELLAKWAIYVYSIEYIGATKDVTFPTQYSLESGDVTLPSASKPHYDFVGWYESADFTGAKVETIKADSKKNFVLYARFTPKIYSVTYDYSGGVKCANAVEYTIESEDITLLPTSKAHYDFVGWQFDGTGAIVEKIEKGSHGDKHFVALFDAVEYSITYANVEDTTDYVAAYTIESDVTLPTPSKQYYDFGGWYLSAEFSGESVSTLSAKANGNVTVYAKFTPTEYSVVYEGADGAMHANVASYTVEDAQITLLDAQKDGYNFLGWYDKTTDKKVSAIDTSKPKDMTLVAKWSVVSVEQPSVFVIDENGIITGINLDVLGDNTVLSVPSSIDGQKVVGIASGVFGAIASTVTEIMIESGVESVAADLFLGMSKLEKLSLPSTISTMHKGMLRDLASLCDLTIPFASFYVQSDDATSATKYSKDQTSGMVYGFSYLFITSANDVDKTIFTSIKTYKLTLGSTNSTAYMGSIKAYIPKTLKTLTVLGGDISERGFREIVDIEKVVLCEDVNYIAKDAFSKCTGLKEVEIRSESATFGASVFAGCSNLIVGVKTQEQIATLEQQGANCQISA